MHTIIWNPQAQENLRSIKSYYLDAGIDEETIDNFLLGIFEATEKLIKHPSSGRIVPEINDPNFREIIWNNTWRIIYMPPNNDDDVVEIMNVLHTAQNFGS
ncbi:type II toxin-antitoxin system RelE/ParE family toxin [Gracilimonas mengyeensis]|uniref:Addiction module toxin, RelE/StbE family n=1 Tax=Gracilimonas mengyeensis TaxID=1302730 RepID=A0A521E3T4_9BACT|nr:type II toxin-antitoxin system RelE/ParE family toxin [Gracilimonas mengyeensis]SMO78597.1 addiction module toxin, RelE/StbE family [Gracilimonas mengyeensis]